MKTYELEKDGALVIREFDGDGAAVRQIDITRDQIALHRRDAEFDVALPAHIRAVLDVDQVRA